MAGFERRIGERFEVGDIPVKWSTSRPVKMTRARRKQLDTSIMGVGYLRNVSMSGAAVVSAHDETLGPGAVVQITLDDSCSFVGRIKRIMKTEDPRWTFYGILYLEVSESYQTWLNTLLNYQRAELTEKTWRRAQ